MKLQPRPSPNFNARPTATIDTLLLHYTGMATAAEAIDRLCDPHAEVSAHYVVEEDGHIWQLVADADRAWHAGASAWRGRRNLNDVSIGVEVVNPGHEWGYRDFPAAQMLAVTDLCLDLIARHKIPARNVLAHSDVAPTRKQDPGERFDWRGLARNGIGLWPNVPDLGTRHVLRDVSEVRQNLHRIGYEIALTGGGDAEFSTVLRAFQRHFRPETVNGLPDHGTVERIRCLLPLLID